MEEITSTLHPHGTMTLAPCTPATILPMAPHEVTSIEDVDVLGLLSTGLEVGSSPVRHRDVMWQGNTSCTIVQLKCMYVFIILFDAYPSVGIDPDIDMNTEFRAPTKKKNMFPGKRSQI
jgi:hypothetical protein